MEYEDLKIESAEGIYNPREDSFLVAKTLKDAIGKYNEREIEALDLGTGTGILGLVAARQNNVRRVVFVDISKSALELAKKNCKLNQNLIKAKCDFVKSDLFSNVNGKFDVITFNAPYLPKEPQEYTKEKLAWDGGEEGVEISIRFLGGLKEHLKERGVALLVASSFSNLKRLLNKAKVFGFKVKERNKVHIFFEDIIVLEITY